MSKEEPNYVSLSPGRSGFQIIYSVTIRNECYLNYECDEIELLKDEKHSVTCILKSGEPDKWIRKSKSLLFIIETFDTAEAAREYADYFIHTIKYYLSKSGCAFNLKYRIKDLSSMEIRFRSFATLSVLVSFRMNAILPVPNEKAKNAVNLLEKAEALPYTELRFFMYVVTLESLLDNDATKVKKTPEFLSALYNIIKYVDDNINLGKNDKKSIIDLLDSFRMIGSRKAVTNFIKKYYPDGKALCGGKSQKYTSIYQKCYTMRNNFVHYGIVDKKIPEYMGAISKIAYDMVFAYANDPGNAK